MKVNVYEYDYAKMKAGELESRINDFCEHYDVVDVQVTRDGDELLLFFFYEE